MNEYAPHGAHSAIAYLIRDPLGDYLVALCPECGRTVPLQPHHQHLDRVRVPRHRCKKKARIVASDLAPKTRLDRRARSAVFGAGEDGTPSA